MVKEGDVIENSVVESMNSHRCGLCCLGPLTFHTQAVGDKVRLSQGGLLAERSGCTFKNGLVFSSRTVRVQEKIRLRVEKDQFNWHGALRVGFTNVSPSSRSLPLPMMAIPDLTKTPGHWAAPLPESLCQAGSVLQFWVSHGGSLFARSNNGRPHKLFTGVDLSQPLWAMIDIYGQTCSIFLLGSEKSVTFYTRRSCPTPEYFTSPQHDNHCNLISDDCISCLDMKADNHSGQDCVVCMGREATVTLPCGHRCLCAGCVRRVVQQFGSCPLCRHDIREPSL
ncbi:E3 ubiquitin-protein ligase NEURL3 [Larimichthys crocea]|uniref:E3 ubiquitin-protein ligase NEURL3 n=1 Tax=Larimichthys crocea TaxID=215358 RepID=UPI000F5E49A8|nr:E3 ubiquitin-protein ligase NEURL3 [Larimichthys crocea]